MGTIPEVGTTNNLAFSPDGALLAYVGADSRGRLWDLVTGKPKPLPPGFPARCVAFAPDSETLAVGEYTPGDGGTSIGRVRLLNVTTTKEKNSWRAGNSIVECLTFSPDGKTLAVGMANPALTLWDVSTRTQVHPPRVTRPKR